MSQACFIRIKKMIEFGIQRERKRGGEENNIIQGIRIFCILSPPTNCMCPVVCIFVLHTLITAEPRRI